MHGWNLILASPLSWRMLFVCLPHHKGSQPTIHILRTKILQFASFEVSTLLWFCGIWHCNTGWVVLEIMKGLAAFIWNVKNLSSKDAESNPRRPECSTHKLCFPSVLYLLFCSCVIQRTSPFQSCMPLPNNTDYSTNQTIWYWHLISFSYWQQ